MEINEWQCEPLRDDKRELCRDWGIYEGTDRNCRIARIENDDATDSDEELAENCEANARLIVRAVNAHEGLVTACHAAWNAFENGKRKHHRDPIAGKCADDCQACAIALLKQVIIDNQ